MGPQSFITRRLLWSLTRSVILAVLAYCARAQAQDHTFLLPTNIVTDDAGNLYVSEADGHVVRKMSASGQLSIVAGTGTQGFAGDGGPAAAAVLDSPRGLAFRDNQLYIADSHNHRVRKVDLNSGLIVTIVGPSARSSSESGDTPPTLELPIALAVGSSGELYIADAQAHRIFRMDSKEGITIVAGIGAQGLDGDGASSRNALLDSPSGLATDAAGNLYIADTRNHRIRRVEAVTGLITTVAGADGFGFNGDGTALATRLALPKGLSVDNQGNIYFADSGNHRIRKIDTGGKVTTIAGDGTQGFSGDGGPPLSSSLDSPGDILASAGVLSMADTGNARIREISGNKIQSGHEGALTPKITITGANAVTYGSGSLLAIVDATGATGMVTFTDRVAVEPVTLATMALQSGPAVLDISTLSAGHHSIVATYGGNARYGGAVSPSFEIVVAPIVLGVTVTPASALYGTVPPPLNAALRGVLAHDQGNVSVNLSTTATALAPVGIYPVTGTLTGASASNYTVTDIPRFSIVPAPTTTSISVSAKDVVDGSSISAGQTVLVTAQVVSSTSGEPTGSLTILDGTTALASGRASGEGTLSVLLSTLTAGTHTLMASYSGDNNLLPSTSSIRSLTIMPPGEGENDFSMTTGSTSQSIVAGEDASFAFTVQPQLALASQIVFTASGLPDSAVATFSPAYASPGATTTVTMTVRTMRTMALDRVFVPWMAALSPCGLVVFLNCRRRTPSLVWFAIASLSILLGGCGDRIYTGKGTGVHNKTYEITVTGTATGDTGTKLQHTITFSLVVVPSS